MPNSRSNPVYRILDASANRAGEGLRTIEEWVRFGENDARITQELKSIRHAIALAVATIPRDQLISARDTTGDVGTKVETDSEYCRNSTTEVITAAVARTGQSLRVIEEYLKTVDVSSARQVEKARYRFYTISAEVERLVSTNDRRSRLDGAQLYALIDCGESKQAFCERIELLAKNGVDIFQLRDRDQDDRTLIARAEIGCEIANQNGALFIMNDRADLAFASNCDGVHVGQEELPVEIARQIVGSDRLIGCSTHNLAQAKAAAEDGADYIGCGPVFPSNTKSFDSFPGTDFLLQVSKDVQLPSFAIGGIDIENLPQVIATGFQRIAVTGVLSQASNPAEKANQLKTTLKNAIQP